MNQGPPSRFAIFWDNWGPSVIAAVVALALSLVYFFYTKSQGMMLLALDDAYTQVTMSHHLAHSGVLGLNAGEEGGGGSSPLWMMLLSLFSWVGIRTDAIAMFLSWVSLGLATAATGRLAFRMLPRRMAWVTTLAVAILGQQAAMGLSGKESLLISAAVIFGLNYHSIGWTRRAAWIFIIGSLVRPEVILAAAAALLGDFIKAMQGRAPHKTKFRAVRVPVERFIYVVVVFLAGLAVLSLLSGSAPSALAGRRWLYGLGAEIFAFETGFVQFGSFVKSLAVRLAAMVGPGGVAGWIWAVVAFALATVGWLNLLIKNRRMGRSLALFVPLLLLFVGIGVGHQGQYSRYLIPVWMLLPVLMALGWQVVAGRIPTNARPVISIVVAALLVAGLVPQTVKWGRWHAKTVEQLREVHLRMAVWVRHNIPDNERVAAFDVGLLSYFGGHKVTDLAGLTDRQIANALHEGTVPALLKRREVKYIIVPEGRYADPVRRLRIAIGMGFEPEQLVGREVKRFRIPFEHEPGETAHGVTYLDASVVAKPQLTLYRLPHTGP